MIIAGLDISSSHTGYAFFEDEKLLDYGVFAPKGTYARDRFPQMIDKLRDFLEGTYQPDVIAAEMFYLNRSFKSVEYIIKQHAYVEYYCAKYDKEFELFMPAAWRKLVGIENYVPKELLTGKQKSRDILKQRDIAFVEKIYGFTPENDDIADAIGIGSAKIKKIFHPQAEN